MRHGPELVLESPVQAAAIPEVRNHTPYPSQYYQMLNADDMVFHAIVTRLSYDLQRLDAQGVPHLATTQTPLVDADQFYFQANTSGTVQESDYAPFKPHCDILFAHARAYPPHGEAMQRWLVDDLSAIGHWWHPHLDLAGSYDDAWTENRWPFLPKDFDFAYWNYVPEDQPIPFPQGGEDILLVGLMPGGGQFHAKLPGNPSYSRVRLHAGTVVQRSMWLDTLTFDMKAMTLCCTHRMTVAAVTGMYVLAICKKMQET